MPDLRRIFYHILALLGQWTIGATFLFSGFVQALVFTLLSMIYISAACPPEEAAGEA